MAGFKLANVRRIDMREDIKLKIDRWPSLQRFTTTKPHKQKKPSLWAASFFTQRFMVPKAGLEPARISTVDFESTASTDFATPARKGCGKRWDYTCQGPPCKQRSCAVLSSAENFSITHSPFSTLSFFFPLTNSLKQSFAGLHHLSFVM